jgi:ferritin-like metal-binding protein YciE
MTTKDILLKYLTDMYALEKHLLQPLKAQADDADFSPYPEARALVQKLHLRTENAVNSLEIQIKELGGDARGGFKAAVTAAAGAVAAVVNEGRTHVITKKLRDDYVALSLVSVGYELLHVTGNALGAENVASASLKHLKEVAAIIMDLSQVIVPVAVDELQKTNPETRVETAVASQVNIREAWQHPDSAYAVA